MKSSDVRILQSDGHGVIVEFSPRSNTPNKIIANGQEFFQYDFTGSRRVEDLIPGTPDIKVRSFLLRFASTSGNTIEIANADYEDVPNVLLLPVAGMHEGEVGPRIRIKLTIRSIVVQQLLPVRLRRLLIFPKPVVPYLENCE